MEEDKQEEQITLKHSDFTKMLDLLDSKEETIKKLKAKVQFSDDQLGLQTKRLDVLEEENDTLKKPAEVTNIDKYLEKYQENVQL